MSEQRLIACANCQHFDNPLSHLECCDSDICVSCLTLCTDCQTPLCSNCDSLPAQICPPTYPDCKRYLRPLCNPCIQKQPNPCSCLLVHLGKDQGSEFCSTCNKEIYPEECDYNLVDTLEGRAKYCFCNVESCEECGTLGEYNGLVLEFCHCCRCQYCSDCARWKYFNFRNQWGSKRTAQVSVPCLKDGSVFSQYDMKGIVNDKLITKSQFNELRPFLTSQFGV